MGTTPPFIIRKVFENGFKNIWGAFAVAGLFLYPLSLYIIRFEIYEGEVTEGLDVFLVRFLLICRLFCGIVECWVVMDHTRIMISIDEKMSIHRDKLR